MQINMNYIYFFFLKLPPFFICNIFHYCLSMHNSPSMLSEPRRKQRICLDPQNLSWLNDTNAFGKRMMEQMGWRDGLGLGKKADGIRENVKPNANHTQRGFGFSGGTRESNWACHDDEFSNILAKLNEDKSAKGSEKGQSNLEGPINVKKSERSSALNIRRKRRPNLSVEDKTAIFGKPPPKLSNISYKAQNNVEKREAPQKQLAENLLFSSITMDEYFAQKKEKKRKRNVKT